MLSPSVEWRRNSYCWDRRSKPQLFLCHSTWGDNIIQITRQSMFCFYIPLFYKQLQVIFSPCQCLRWPLSSPYILLLRAVTAHYSTAAQTNQCVYATVDGGMGDRKGWDISKGALMKFIITTILYSLGYWPTIGLYFIRYKKKTTFIWCALCGEIVPHTGDPQQIITYMCNNTSR